jgi:hypothetical protein
LSTSRECSEDMPNSFVTGTSARCQGSGRQSSSGVVVGEVADIMFDESLQTHCH